MSFLSTLHKIVTVAGKAQPYVGAVNPLAGGLLGGILQAIIAVEGLMPEDKLGKTKKQLVTLITCEKAAAAGVSVDPVQLSVTIDALVAAMNRGDALRITQPPQFRPGGVFMTQENLGILGDK